ncbi:MAG: dCTP deaminase [Bacteroidetes bacterium]|nr:dCTP deaminase [Bacteroidota bacterium]MBX7045296.1 dCTP deaminase [Ignavibacteria bacterium]
MILSDKKILEEIENKNIVISPFDRKCLGTNSYDVHLGEWLSVYDDDVLDAKKHNKATSFKMSKDGHLLLPSRLYLGVTQEYTETYKYVPFLEGKSSIGRLGIDIHATAGKGDVGFKNFWTLEISVKQPCIVYPFMPIGQLIYFMVEGEVENSYDKKKSAKYNKKNNKPVESMMWKNFLKNK